MAGDEPLDFSADDLKMLDGMPDGDDDGGEGDAPVDGDKPASEAKPGADGKPAGADKSRSEVKPAPDAAGKAAKGGKDGGAADDEPLTEWPPEGFPADWRERTVKMLGLEGEALKRAEARAKRFASPADLMRSFLAADAKIGETAADLKDRVKLPGAKGAKAEDVAAFAKAWGVPEGPDKYDLAVVGEMTDLDKEIWDEVLPTFHKGHFSQTQIAEVGKALKTAETIAAKRMEERAIAIDEATEEALRVEYPGKEYKANVELANRYLGALLGKHMPDAAERKAFLDLKLADGTRIGSHVPFVKAMVEAARAWSPDALPETGEGGNAVDPEQRIKEIIALSHTSKDADKQEYERLQPELKELIKARNRRNAVKK